MYKTITLGSCVAVQGKFVKSYDDGRVAIRVGKEVFVGVPVPTQSKAGKKPIAAAAS